MPGLAAGLDRLDFVDDIGSANDLAENRVTPALAVGAVWSSKLLRSMLMKNCELAE